VIISRKQEYYDKIFPYYSEYYSQFGENFATKTKMLVTTWIASKLIMFKDIANVPRIHLTIRNFNVHINGVKMM